MKTAKEWFSELEEPYSSQAIENIELDIACKSLREAFFFAFIWSDTPQGYNYWYDLVNHTYLE